MKRFLYTFALVAATVFSTSAQLPDTEIIIVDLVKSPTDGSYRVGNPKNITNRPGYDNQPSFTLDNKAILYSSIRNGQADIYRYEIETGKTTQLTNTPEDEFSPTHTFDGDYFTVVRVEKDSTQRLWAFPINGGEPHLLMPEIKGIGYHAWVDEKWVALFMLGDTFSLQIADVTKGKGFIGHKPIGRSLNTRYGDFLAFTSEGAIYIANYVDGDINNPLYTPQRFITLPDGVEDFAILPDGTFLCSKNRQLLKFNITTDNEWLAIADFNGTIVGEFYRIAVSPDGKKLALVTFAGKKP